MAALKEGQVINTAGHGTVKIIRASEKKLELGSGGQGIVYKVDYNGKEMALKWYFKNEMKEPIAFYNNIKNNIDTGRPTEAFLWPVDITEWVDDTFGYIMPLCPPGFSDFSNYLLAKDNFKSDKALINAALNIVDGFMNLHRIGFNYQDLNDGNFFINFETGEVLICDNDNVRGHGFSSGIAGKLRYMAPEIARGEKLPDTTTDRFSLAVILFLLLCVNHPLEGRLMIQDDPITLDDEKRLYGIDPVFIFDPKDTRNAPVPQTSANAIKLWKQTPKYIQDLFIDAFNYERLHGKIPQVLESDWIKVLVRWRSEILKCSCGDENYADSFGRFTCSCGANRKVPVHFQFKRMSISIYPGVTLYACHTILDCDDFKTETARVITKKDNPKAMGLLNLSDKIWTLTKLDGTTESKAKGEVAPIGKGFIIDFGNNNVAEIVAN